VENFYEVYFNLRLLMFAGMALYFPVYALMIWLGMGHNYSDTNPASNGDDYEY